MPLSRFPGYSQRTISYKYHPLNPLTHSSPTPSPIPSLPPVGLLSVRLVRPYIRVSCPTILLVSLYLDELVRKIHQKVLQRVGLHIMSSQSMLRSRAVLLMLGYLTTKSTCCRQHSFTLTLKLKDMTRSLSVSVKN
jgi:hypothetical protein